jgi:hypothetical protein
MVVSQLDLLVDIFLLLCLKQLKEKILKENALFVQILIEKLEREQIHVICVKTVTWVFAQLIASKNFILW